MALQVTCFASGSSGNAFLVRCSEAALLIDCGLSQRAIERHLARVGMRPADLSAILLTHEHGDHAGCADGLARRHGLIVVANQPTHRALRTDLGASEYVLPTGAAIEIGPFAIQSFPVSHDAAEPVGYTIRAAGACVGIAIDLGCWDSTVEAGLLPADLVILEANYDHERLRIAPYAWPVKQRIFGRLGHLDNVAAAELLARLGADGRRRTAWLAHLSEQANSPEIAVRVVLNVLSLAGVTGMRVNALPRRVPPGQTPIFWESTTHIQQMELFGEF